jgi:hypothetical protein
MLLKMTCAGVILFFTLPSIAGAAPESPVIAKAVAVCKTNPICSYQKTDASGNTMFKIKMAKLAKQVVCHQNGNCEFLMPKGKKSPVPDIAAWLATD